MRHTGPGRGHYHPRILQDLVASPSSRTAIERQATLLGNTHPALWSCWHPVARSCEVGEQPLRILLLGEAYVCFRSGGRVVAFLDRCPHRGAPLSAGRCEEGMLRCAYHGWLFEPGGSCTELPALGPGATLPPAAHLRPPAGVAEHLGLVFLAPEAPLTELPEVPEAGAEDFERGELVPIRARASAGLLADNFLDFAHFPFLHRASFGAEESAEIAPYPLERRGLDFQVVYQHPFANREDPGVAAGLRPLVQTRRMTYRYRAPFALSLRLEFLEAGGVNTIGFFLQPEDGEHVRCYTVLWRNDLGGDPARWAEALAFEQQVLEEDLALQARYDLLALPLEPTAEVHTRADRITLELRRVLAELVGQASRDAASGTPGEQPAPRTAAGGRRAGASALG